MKQKLLIKSKRNAYDWQIKDLKNLAKDYGMVIRQPGTSHVTFTKVGTGIPLTVPSHKTIKPNYIKKFMELIEKIEKEEKKMTEVKYPLTIKPLSKEEGGGYQVEYLDLPGCMADGETVEEALREGEDAVLAWIRSAKEDGEPIPEPRSLDKYSGQWRIRVPKSLHAQLDAKAKLEGVSLNTVSIALLAERITRRNILNHLGKH